MLSLYRSWFDSATSGAEFSDTFFLQANPVQSSRVVQNKNKRCFMLQGGVQMYANYNEETIPRVASLYRSPGLRLKELLLKKIDNTGTPLTFSKPHIIIAPG